MESAKRSGSVHWCAIDVLPVYLGTEGLGTNRVPFRRGINRPAPRYKLSAPFLSLAFKTMKFLPQLVTALFAALITNVAALPTPDASRRNPG